MNCTDFINILAIICSPVIAVFVGRFLQDREKNRNDKGRLIICIFQQRWQRQLMLKPNTSRIKHLMTSIIEI